MLENNPYSIYTKAKVTFKVNDKEKRVRLYFQNTA